MSKYRIGTTISISVTASNLPSTNVQFFVKSDFGLHKLNGVSVSGSTISGSFLGSDQKFLGDYSILVRSGSRSLCIDNAFSLVKHSEETEDADSTTVTKSGSFLTSPSHVSGYEEWRNTHGGGVQDYWNWLREDSSAISSRVTVVEQRITDEEYARKAADETLRSSINNEATLRERGDDTLQANITAEETARKAADEMLGQTIEAVRGEWRNDLADETQNRQDADAAEAKTREEADAELQKNIDDETAARTEADEALDARHTRGKLFCNGILEFNEEPKEQGYYLQKDVDGDIACLTYLDEEGKKEYVDAPLDCIFVVGEQSYKRDLFKIVPISYKEVIIKVATPMDSNDDVDYTIVCDVGYSPTKKIQLTSIKR